MSKSPILQIGGPRVLEESILEIPTLERNIRIGRLEVFNRHYLSSVSIQIKPDKVADYLLQLCSNAWFEKNAL